MRPRHVEQIESVLDLVRLTAQDRQVIDAVLSRPDLTSERAWGIRAARRAQPEAQTRLAGAASKLAATLATHCPPPTVRDDWSVRVAP
jgi:hypothetical protein